MDKPVCRCRYIYYTESTHYNIGLKDDNRKHVKRTNHPIGTCRYKLRRYIKTTCNLLDLNAQHFYVKYILQDYNIIQRGASIKT